MKSQLQLFLYIFFVFGTVVFTNKGYSQTNYSQNFDAETVDWTTTGFSLTTTLPCEGNQSARINIYNFNTSGQITSSNIGTSNGGLSTLSFQYKLLNYAFPTPTVPTPNGGDWGLINVAYGASAAGPFTEIGQITPATHIESVDCALKTITFTPPVGTQVFIRISATLGTAGNDFYFYFDDVIVSQAPVACAGTPAASSAIAQKAVVCNGLAASLSLSPVYTTTGLTFQWQKSTDGVAYANITGATSATLSSPQTVNTWYRAIITCAAGGTPVTSAPVQVTNNGFPCLCELEFASQVEPITRVQFAGINNLSSAEVDGSPSLENFSALPPGQVVVGNSYPIVLEGNTNDPFEDGYISYFKVYIDFNHNGILNDPGEFFEIGTLEGSDGTDGIQVTGNITIPSTALTGLAYMRVFKLFNEYSGDPCGTEYEYGQAEDYLLNITPACATVAPVVVSAQSFCVGATVANLQATGTAVKWYLTPTGGSPLGATIPIVNNTIYYASQTIGCEGVVRAAVTATINIVTVDAVQDVAACSNYVLPALTNGDYYTATAGGGTMVAAGTVITETTTLYVYKQVGTTTVCSAEDSFVITITSVVADDLDDVSTCSGYVLPVLENGNYYTAANGGGTMLSAGDVIAETVTVYIYAVSETNVACTAENSFVVTVNEIVAAEFDDVTACFEYELPVLENGAYYTAAAGGGTMLSAGSVVTENTTVYIYVVSQDNPACTAESSFEIAINAPVPPSGDINIEYIVNEGQDILLYDVDLVATGVIVWYANIDDAIAGENSLPEDTIIPNGTTTYYATQIIGECESAPFAVTVDVVLGGKDFDLASFKYYPNPVNSVLNLSYSKTITGVTVFNLLGQEVISKTANQGEVQIDLSQLAAGTYIVKVQSEDAFKLIKVVKK